MNKITVYGKNLQKLKDLKYFKNIHIRILAYMTTWIIQNNLYGNNLTSKELEDGVFYNIDIGKISEDTDLSYQQVQRSLKRLANKDEKIDYKNEPIMKTKFDGRHLWFAFNWLYLSALCDFDFVSILEKKIQSECNFEVKEQKKLPGNVYNVRKVKNSNEGKTMNELFDIETSGVCREADSIARLIMKKYPQYFHHNVPKLDTVPTKTYVKVCRRICDVYNGNFTKSRFYSFSDKFKSKVNGDYESKLNEVIGDWNKVKKLILSALNNFDLMHDEQRLPYNKKYLQTNLDMWFYDSFSIKGEGQSQFIQCLFEPEYIAKHHSELKADKIFETLDNTAKKAGNKLFEMNTNMPSGLFWENIKKMIEWGKNAIKFERASISYWLRSASDLPSMFADFCKENDISVSISTIDIEKAVECNSPWTWFVKDACKKYGFNTELAECYDEDSMKKCYRTSKLIKNSVYDDVKIIF